MCVSCPRRAVRCCCSYITNYYCWIDSYYRNKTAHSLAQITFVWARWRNWKFRQNRNSKINRHKQTACGKNLNCFCFFCLFFLFFRGKASEREKETFVSLRQQCLASVCQSWTTLAAAVRCRCSRRRRRQFNRYASSATSWPRWRCGRKRIGCCASDVLSSSSRPGDAPRPRSATRSRPTSTSTRSA